MTKKNSSNGFESEEAFVGTTEELFPAEEPAAVTAPEAKATFDPYEAQFIMGADNANDWIANTYKRLVGRFKSVLYTGDGVKEKHLNFVGTLCRRAIRKDGVLFVPKALKNLPAFEGMDSLVEGAWVKLSERNN